MEILQEVRAEHRRRKQLRSAHSGARASRSWSDYGRGYSVSSFGAREPERRTVVSRRRRCRPRPVQDSAAADWNRRQTRRVRSAGMTSMACPAAARSEADSHQVDSAGAAARSAGSKQFCSMDRRDAARRLDGWFHKSSKQNSECHRDIQRGFARRCDESSTQDMPVQPMQASRSRQDCRTRVHEPLSGDKDRAHRFTGSENTEPTSLTGRRSLAPWKKSA